MLTDGIADHAPVPPQHMPRRVDKIAAGRGFARQAFNGGGVIAVGDEADVLTVRLFGVLQTALRRQRLRAPRALSSSPSGNSVLRKLLLRHRIEYVALVLARSSRAFA